jgi:hypothetical protein
MMACWPTGLVLLLVCVLFNYQQRCGYRVAVKSLHMSRRGVDGGCCGLRDGGG